MSDQPTTPLPLPGQANLPPAWTDDATRRTVNRNLWLALLLGLIAVAAAVGGVAVVQLGYLGEPWGLGVLVAAAGVAGGALAGAVTLGVIYGRTRGFLRRGPWVPGELTLEEGKRAELSHGRAVGDVRLEIRTGALGDPGESIGVEVRSDGDRILITAPPSRRIIRAAPAPVDRDEEPEQAGQGESSEQDGIDGEAGARHAL